MCSSQTIGCYRDHSILRNHVSNIEFILIMNYWCSVVRALVKFVQEHLADPTIKFYLCKLLCLMLAANDGVNIDTTPPKTVLTNAKLTLVEAGLVPASIVHFGLHDNKGTNNRIQLVVIT